MDSASRIEVAELVSAIARGIAAERAAVRESLGRLADVDAVPVHAGREISSEPGAHRFHFSCTLDLPIPEGTRVQLQAGPSAVSGEVVEHDWELETIECVFGQHPGDAREGKLQFDSTYLLDMLRARLQEIADAEAGLPPQPGLRFFTARALELLDGRGQRRPPVPLSRPGPSRSQLDAISFVLGQDVAYLWGPPGTGKTSTVAHLVHELIARGEKVLLAVHTNTATDTALLKVLAAAPLARGKAIRVGHVGEELRERGVQLEDAVAGLLARDPELCAAIARLCDDVAELLQDPPNTLLSDRVSPARRLRVASGILDASRFADHVDLLQRALDLTAELEALYEQLIAEASVVATTLTRLFTSRLLKNFRTDAVIVDEASIASLAHSFVAATLARRRVVAVGDFMQLPAIVQASQPDARYWLGSNVFQSAECDDAATDHPLRAMLDEQWRMQPGISKVISRIFYASRLRDAPAVLARRREGAVAALVDTARLGPRSERPSAGSKRNRVHAELIARLVGQARSKDIAVIAPYRAQVRLIRELIAQSRPDLLKSGAVEVFTVHRFQGRDKELVIFDCVEAPGTDAPFLDDVRTPEARNLVNVALSRAKERLVVVAHAAHVSTVLSRRGTLVRVFAELRAADCLELIAGDSADEARLRRFLEEE